VAYIVTNMLQDVVARGTGTAVRAVGFNGVAAGKTGTTNDAADIWFVGYTPRLVGTIWMGFDKRKTILRGATGGELAAPLWGRIMQRIAGYTAEWPVPPGVEIRPVDSYGNVLADNCPTQGETHPEVFLTGTAPFSACYTDPGYLGPDTLAGFDTLDIYDDRWWQRLRRRVLGTDTTRIEQRPDADSVWRDTARRDTVRRDTLRRDTISGLLGRPIPNVPSRRR
jgi:membrane peptidoglycan carboxypeptidase